MTIEKLDLSKTGSFSQIFLDYLAEKPELRSFYEQPPQIQCFQQQIENKKFSLQQREMLSEILYEQYTSLKVAGPARANLEKIKDSNTFTVTTGHQLNIFTGPLYFIYKIATVINLSKQLQSAYPEYHFIPVYWMASEDHDFEEINHFSLFGKTYTWHTDQNGAVGRFDTASLDQVLQELPVSAPVFDEAYRSCKTLAEAVRFYVNELFGEEGLLVIDADHAAFKSSFRSVIADDLTQHTAHDLVGKTSDQLDAMEYKTQIHPREINFFYLKDQLRERIVREGDLYGVMNTNIRFTKDELLNEVEEHSEYFSPNVVLRPLYQEFILPNLAYIGGPAEVAYWLQLKPMFDRYQVPFPVLLPRNFVMVIGHSENRKLKKLPISLDKLFLETQSLIKQFVAENTENELSLTTEQVALEEVYNQIREKAVAIDKTLDGYIGAETTRMLKSLKEIEKKLKKSEERNHDIAIGQLTSLKEKLFPGSGLQERKENFLNFYHNNPGFIKELLNCLDPLDFRFYVLREGED